jgi:hypothetical protein
VTLLRGVIHAPQNCVIPAPQNCVVPAPQSCVVPAPQSCVVPAKAGTQCRRHERRWIPAFAGTTAFA